MHGRPLTLDEIKRLKDFWNRIQGDHTAVYTGPDEWYWVCSANWWALHEAQAGILGLRRAS